MNNIVPLRTGQVPAVFANRANLPDMNAAAQQGLAAAFAVIGYKGRNWRIKYRGEDELLKDGRGVPIPALDVVVVGLSPAISKQWYDKRYTEGDNEAPDCFSIDGIKPDRASPKVQCASCAACPQNVWGSRTTEAGKKAKACQDSRRIAVVPLGDIQNDGYGGPMLLRVPPMSLANLAKYTTEIGRYGAQPFMIQTQLHFNYDVAYPMIEFTALGWLDEAQASAVAEVMDSPLIERMLETEVVEASADPVGEQNALAGGRPATAFTAAEQAEIQKEAERQAWAAQEARQAAEKQAAAERAQAEAQAARAQAQAAPPKKTASAFVTAPAATPADTPAAASPAPNAALAGAPATGTKVLQQAPSDMDAAIDDLLAS
jgi:hypothetical protein